MSVDALSRLWRRVLLATGRGHVTNVDDTGPVQLLQVQLGDDEIQSGMPRVAEYGFTSVPPLGSHAMATFVAGERSNGAVIGTNDPASRLRGLQPGDSAMHDNRGRRVVMNDTGIFVEGADSPVSVRTNGEIDVTSAGGNINVAAPAGSVNITAVNIVLTGTVTANGVPIDDTHVHTGVRSGGDLSGPPSP